MKFLNEEATASRTIDKDLADLDRRWNTMAKDILERIELVSIVAAYDGMVTVLW